MRASESFYKRFVLDESGQAITEYGAMLAFVAILISFLFGIAQGALKGAVSASFSTTVKSLNNISAGAANATS